MREYEVKYYIDDKEMLQGEKPHSEISSGELSPERDGERINFVDADGEIVMQYYNFSVDSPIKAARMEAGLSRAEMSRRFEIPIRTLENWEAGTRIPPVWAEKLIVEKLETMADGV